MKTLTVVALVALFPFAVLAVPPKGAGSTAAASLYAAWSAEWSSTKKTTGLEYSAVGSSAGLKAVQEGKADFGASDVAPKRADLDRDGLVVFPTAISGVVPVFNVPGLSNGSLKLTGVVLSKLLTGEISRWDASEIRALNPGVKLPAIPVKRVVREDGSGTTFVLSDYLSKVSEDWKERLGSGFTVKWPEGATQVKGGGKMLEAVKATPGAIGYVEYGQAIEAAVPWALIKNKAERWPEPGAQSFSAALRNTGWTRSGEFEEMLTNSSEPEAWPITGATFVVMKKTQAHPETAASVLSFFTWAFMHGDSIAQRLRWIPLPINTQARVVKEMSKLRDPSGQAITFSYVQ